MGLLSFSCSAIWLIITLTVSLLQLAEHLVFGKSVFITSLGEFLVSIMSPFFSQHTLEKLRDLFTWGVPNIVLGSKSDDRFLMPVFQRNDGLTLKLGYIVSREQFGVTYAVKNIMIQANLNEVTLTISPVEINGSSVELKNEEMVCDIDDVQLVNCKNISTNVAMDGMEMVARSISSYPEHVQKLIRRHQLAVAMRKEAQKFLGGFSMSGISSLGSVDWKLDPDILQIERNNDFSVEYRIEKSMEQVSTMDLLMGREWDVRSVSGMDGYRIILTLEVTVDSNQELTMKMHATLMTGKLDPTCYRTVCLRDTTNLHAGCDRRLSDITQDGGSRANTQGLTLAWDEFQTQSAENSPSHAPCVPVVTVSMDDMLTGSGSIGFPTSSTAFQSLEKLLSSIPQSQMVFNSPIKEVSREFTRLSTTAGTGPNTSTPADDLDMTGDHSRNDVANTHSRLDAPEISPHSSPSLQGHRTVEEDVTKKDSELKEETPASPKLYEITGDMDLINQSTTPVPFEQVEVIAFQDSSSPYEEIAVIKDESINTCEVKERNFVSEFVQVFEKDCDVSIGASDAVKPSPNISMDDMPSPGRPLVSFLSSDPLLTTENTSDQAGNSLLCSPPKNSNLARVQEYLQSLPSPGRRDTLPETPNSKILDNQDTSTSTPGVTDDCNESQCSESQSVASRQSELSSLTGAKRMGGGMFYGMTPASNENQAPVCPFPEDWQFNTIPESIENDDDLD